MKITVEMLEEKRACSDQVKIFKELFPDGAIVNINNVGLAIENYLDINWAAYALFTVPALEEYEKVTVPAREEYKKVTTPALEEYIKVTTPAWEGYEKVTVPAREEYEKVRVPAWEEYKKVTAPEWEEYKKVIAQAWKKYEKVKAQAFVEAYHTQLPVEIPAFFTSKDGNGLRCHDPAQAAALLRAILDSAPDDVLAAAEIVLTYLEN